jgi:hypothetical protein
MEDIVEDIEADTVECAWVSCAHPSIRTAAVGQPTLRSGRAPMRTDDECSRHASTRDRYVFLVLASWFVFVFGVRCLSEVLESS